MEGLLLLIQPNGMGRKAILYGNIRRSIWPIYRKDIEVQMLRKTNII